MDEISLKNYKENLKEIIEWYKNEYWKLSENNDWTKDLVNDIDKAKNKEDLELIEQTIDEWLN